MKPRLSRFGAILLTAAATSLPLAGVDPSTQACPAIDGPPFMAAARVRAFIDPDTGRLRAPTQEELRQLALERLRSAAPAPDFEMVVHPDGMKSVDLKDAFLFDVILETRTDGSTAMRCVPRAGRISTAQGKQGK